MAERRRRRRADETPPEQPNSRRTALLRKVKNRVERGRSERKRWREEYRVDELARCAYGPRSELEDAWSDVETIWINKFDPTLKVLLPSLYFNAPKFKYDVISNDRSSERRQQADLIEALISRIVQEDRQLEIAGRLAIQQSMHSVGVVKIIYNPKMEPNPRKGEPIFMTDDSGEPLLDESGEAQFLTDAEGRPVVEPDEIVSDEVYRIEWVNAENIIFPAGIVDPGKWPWIAEEITVPLEEAKEDRRIPRAVRRGLRSNVPRESDGLFEESEWVASEEDDGDFRYIEYYDFKAQRYYAWADGFSNRNESTSDEPGTDDDFLFDEPIPRGIEDHPYSVLIYTPILDPKPKAWPLPLTYNWLPIERDHNERRQQLSNAARHSARKVFYEQSTFLDHEQASIALQSSTDMEAVQVNDITRIPVVQSDPPPPTNISADLAALEGDWQRATGLASSAFGTRAGSATEARLENQAGSIRESDLRRSVSMFMEDIGRKLFKLVKATMTIGMSVKTASMSDRDMSAAIDGRFGPGTSQQLMQSPGFKQAFIDRFGDEQWYEVNREDITFDADVTIVPGSMKSRTIEAERQQFLEFMQVVFSSPVGLQSRELLLTFSRMFEFIDERLVDELVALGEKQAALEAQKAGRFQGDDGGAAGAAAVQAASGPPSMSSNNGFSLERLLTG